MVITYYGWYIKKQNTSDKYESTLTKNILEKHVFQFTIYSF